MSRIRGIAVATALLATIASTLSVYPHQLVYFNEIAGGPGNGSQHLLGSNFDWGQDLLYVKEWAVARSSLREFDLYYYGGFPPSACGIEFTASGTVDHRYVVISENFLVGEKRHFWDERNQIKVVPPVLITALGAMPPKYVLGKTILVFDLCDGLQH